MFWIISENPSEFWAGGMNWGNRDQQLGASDSKCRYIYLVPVSSCAKEGNNENFQTELNKFLECIGNNSSVRAHAYHVQDPEFNPQTTWYYITRGFESTWTLPDHNTTLLEPNIEPPESRPSIAWYNSTAGFELCISSWYFRKLFKKISYTEIGTQ